MKKNPAMRIALLLSALMLFNLKLLHAQENDPIYTVGVNAGTFIYQGDLAPSALGSFKTPRFAFGFNAGRSLSHVMSARIDMSFGSLSGDDQKYPVDLWRPKRNFKFSSSVSELTAALVYNPIGTERFIDPYFYVAAGYSYVNIKRDYSQFDAEYFGGDPLVAGLKKDLGQPLPKVIPITTLGVGLVHPLSKRIGITGEASYRLMSTDYLDGFSRSANPNQMDHYYKFAIGLQYRFFNTFSYDCPTIF